jgi:hypothetical protein
MKETEKTPCPRCGSTPVIARHGSRYWKAMCPKDHGLHSVVGHPMKTQREAWEQWEAIQEVKQSRPENSAN